MELAKFTSDHDIDSVYGMAFFRVGAWSVVTPISHDAKRECYVTTIIQYSVKTTKPILEILSTRDSPTPLRKST